MVEFTSRSDIITVVVGIDGSLPPLDIQRDIEALVEGQINRKVDYRVGRDTATLTIDENPTKDAKNFLGSRTQYIQKYDVNMEYHNIDQEMMNAVHNEVVEVVSDHGFNITGTATVWDGDVHR